MSNRITVRGTLLDKGGQPVDQAIVMIIGGPESVTDIASVTDPSGGFSLSNISVPGQYVLQIQLDGKSVRREVEVQGPGPLLITL